MTTAPEPQGLICIGASAGGLRSIETLLRGLAPDVSWPVLVAQHMQPERASQLPALLARATSLPVHEAHDGAMPQAGHVYVCPSGSELGVSPEGRLALRPPAAGRPQRIDHLFSTASFARPGLVVAVVLSGTGTDGAGGSLIVKLNGGTVLVESESTAHSLGMPAAAERAGAVDSVCAADDLGPLVSRLADGALQEATESAHRVLRRIAGTLARHTRTEFESYRLATLRRRVEKRRVLAATPTLEAYADLVERDEEERRALVQSLLIPVTEFFRDPHAWEGLASHVLPDVLAPARDGAPIRMWCAGCATGEEAYTLAMLVAERLPDPGMVEIVATDLAGDVIQTARRGLYPPSRLREVAAGRLARFFDQDQDAYHVREEVRSLVRFEVQDVTREAPPGTFDLIVCRNVLIYFEEDLQARVLDRFRRSLRPNGTLFLGRSEALPRGHDGFTATGARLRLFQAAAPVADAADAAPTDPTDPLAPHRGQDGSAGTASEVSALLLADSDALLLVVDPSWRVTSANPRARKILGQDAIGASLLDVLPAWRDSPVHDALRTSLGTGRSVRVLGAPTPHGAFDLIIEPFPPNAHTLLLVAHVARPPPRPSAQDHLAADLATTNDELQAANEELAAANEELQASNEELASLNEEFQSTNDNLAATNAGLRATADPAPSDLLRALLTSRPDAIVLCDRDRRVVLFNPAAERLLGIAPAALGHPLDLPAIGATRALLDAWLDACSPGSPPQQRSCGGMHVRIETLLVHANPIGWMLTCSPVTPGR